MKYYAEITLNNKPKNKAEEDCQLIALDFHKKLIVSEQVRDSAVRFIQSAVKHTNTKHYRCSDVLVGSFNHDNLTITIGENLQITFKQITSEITSI